MFHSQHTFQYGNQMNDIIIHLTVQMTEHDFSDMNACFHFLKLNFCRIDVTLFSVLLQVKFTSKQTAVITLSSSVQPETCGEQKEANHAGVKWLRASNDTFLASIRAGGDAVSYIDCLLFMAKI